MVDKGDGRKGRRSVSKEDIPDNISFRRRRSNDRTGRYILLVITFVQPDIMGSGRTQGGGLDDTRPAGRMDGRRVGKNILCIDLPFEIEKGLHGKEDAIHREEQGVKQYPMDSFYHLYKDSNKI